MRRSERLLLVLFLLLAAGAGVLGPRVARRLEQGGALRLELARLRPTALAPATVACFGALEERVLATYYVSAPARMPAAMRRLELEVGDLFAALRTRFPARFDFQLVDPEAEEGLAGFAARRKVAPFKVKSITRDAWDERTVYSTLALSVGTRPEVRLPGLGPEHLPHLEEWLVGTLRELARPRAARITLAAPAGPGAGFEELADALATRGTLTRVDLDAGEALPTTDLLFWLRPRRVSGAQLAELGRSLAAGTSVVLAGGLLEPNEELRGDVPFVSFRRPESAMVELATHFGLALEPGLVLDTNCEALEFGGVERPTPHWIRCIAPDQDFHRFASQPNGTLLFRAPSTLTPVPARLAELGWEAEVLATTSDGSWLVPEPPREPVELASLVRSESAAVAKQALLVALRHPDPWHGRLVVAAAETPFADGFFRREHNAHARLLEVLLEETTSSERLVLAGIDLARPAPLPPFTSGARLAWRVFGIALPLALLLACVHGRGLARGATELVRLARRSVAALALPATASGVLFLVVAATRALDARLDLSAGARNSLAPAARAIAARSARLGSVAAHLYVSERAQLPPALRAPAQRLSELLREFAAAGAPLEPTRTDPAALAPPARAALEAQGVGLHLGSSSDDGVTRVTRFTCALVLEHDGRRVVLDFPDARSLERLEFRLAFALERLGGRVVPRVAFASDAPRLSAAEAFEQFQEKGLFAPRGTDVFALARATLARDGLEVVHVNPRAPVLPEHGDVLVWLQPRRSIEPMLEETVRVLHGGGRVVLAAQHFDLKAQQFRGGDFAPKYWPQPQNPDLEHLYFPELGIELVREVLFDELCLPIDTESQLTGRRGTRDFERQASALPFQIRLSAAGFAAEPLMRGLGDQAFLWANRLRWDERRLAELGLTATPLAWSSPRTWSFAWKGGWVPPELLAGPVALEGSSGEFLGPQPLIVRFEGTFPRPAGALRLGPAAETEPSDTAAPEARPWPASAPGTLLFLGDSAFLENDALASQEFRGDRLLWNAVASLAFEGELRELATRAHAPGGFGLVAPRTRLGLRTLAIAGGPLVLVAAAAAFASLRRRAPRPPRMEARA